MNDWTRQIEAWSLPTPKIYTFNVSLRILDHSPPTGLTTHAIILVVADVNLVVVASAAAVIVGAWRVSCEKGSTSLFFLRCSYQIQIHDNKLYVMGKTANLIEILDGFFDVDISFLFSRFASLVFRWSLSKCEKTTDDVVRTHRYIKGNIELCSISRFAEIKSTTSIPRIIHLDNSKLWVQFLWFFLFRLNKTK